MTMKKTNYKIDEPQRVPDIVFLWKLKKEKKKEIVIFYTEILTGKLFCGVFLQVKRVKKIHNSTFLVKITV